MDEADPARVCPECGHALTVRLLKTGRVLIICEKCAYHSAYDPLHPPGDACPVDPNKGVLQVVGSKGDIYHVEYVIEDGHPLAIFCTCIGFHFRHHCRHLQIAEDALKSRPAFECKAKCRKACKKKLEQKVADVVAV